MIIFIFFTYIKAWIREKRKIYEGANAMGVIVHIPYKKRKKRSTEINCNKNERRNCTEDQIQVKVEIKYKKKY